jgi:hypothetical protein
MMKQRQRIEAKGKSNREQALAAFMAKKVEIGLIETLI